MTFPDRVKQFLLARFIPQRTMVGLTAGALVVTGALDKLTHSDLCTGATAIGVCAIATKLLSVAAPWLVYIGVADRNRE